MVKQKPRPPRVYVDEKGRYIKLKGKRVYIKSSLSNKQLINVVVNNFQKKKRSRSKKKVQKKEIEDLEKLNKAQANDLAKVMFFIAANDKDKADRDRKLMEQQARLLGQAQPAGYLPGQPQPRGYLPGQPQPRGNLPGQPQPRGNIPGQQQRPELPPIPGEKERMKKLLAEKDDEIINMKKIIQFQQENMKKFQEDTAKNAYIVRDKVRDKIYEEGERRRQAETLAKQSILQAQLAAQEAEEDNKKDGKGSRK